MSKCEICDGEDDHAGLCLSHYYEREREERIFNSVELTTRRIEGFVDEVYFDNKLVATISPEDDKYRIKFTGPEKEWYTDTLCSCREYALYDIQEMEAEKLR